MLGKLNNQDELSDFIDGSWGCKRNVDLETTLTPGRYMIIVEIEWTPNLRSRVFSISSYSEQEVELV